MQKKAFRLLGVFMVFAFLASSLSSCVSTVSTIARGIEHAHLEVQAKMSDTIFLEPVKPDQKTIYVEFRNTSQVPMPDLKQMVISKLQEKGYTIVEDPYKAEFWLQGNVLYMGKQSEHMTMAGLLAGGYGGALTGLAFGRGWGKVGAVGVGSAVGAAAGAVVGAAIHVDTYLGAVDIQIKQKVNGVIQKQVNSNLQNGMGTTESTTYKTTTQYQAYRTRIVVQATQTNLNLKKATPVIEDRLAKEIAGIFN
ncbi:complement resistance protein TraT [Hippea maritima]|uniref:TraT complement resistance family protein n=1 Tax=Hippea maritima (strain ATCC 700847 / DSM 10411 / MH2) TaxID=760142 RepID=F2LV61_HIPMA|nr:complement resistance protein TraT [Hippea maritima]AEA33645.1 TraT complement resistance family protein [Hippea maritima DSM 10411]